MAICTKAVQSLGTVKEHGWLTYKLRIVHELCQMGIPW